MGFCKNNREYCLMGFNDKEKNTATSNLDIAAVVMVMSVVFWSISQPYTDTCRKHTYKRVKTKYRFKIFTGLNLTKKCCHSNGTHTLQKTSQAPFEPNEWVGYKWIEKRNKCIHEWRIRAIKESRRVYMVLQKHTVLSGGGKYSP